MFEAALNLILKLFMPKLCKRGKDAAKKVFKVYPSAYANGYAAQVCLGKKPGLNGKYEIDPEYASHKEVDTGLARWFKEKWVNVCEKDSRGKHPPCGRKNANLSPRSYPYCRPSVRVTKETPKTVGELTKTEIKRRCSKKRRSPVPSRVNADSTNGSSRSVSGSLAKSKKVIKTNKNKEMPWVPVDLAKKFENYAKERGVSKVARGEIASSQSDLGFFEVYKSNGGNYKRLEHIPIKQHSGQNWRQRRNNFCERHSAQMRKNSRPSVEETGKYKGLPTRQETGMIMWACSHLSNSELRKMAKKL